MTGSFAAISANNEIKSATYVNTKNVVSADSWPPKFWKFCLTMEDKARVAFIAVGLPSRLFMLAPVSFCNLFSTSGS
jgi:hypothetical protein